MRCAYLLVTAAATARPAQLITGAVPAAVGGPPATHPFGMGATALVVVTVFAAIFGLMVFVGGLREDRRRRRRR